MNLIRHTLTAALLVASTITHAQSGAPSINPTLAAQIATIPAIDNHAHPLLAPPAYATDRNFDALPVDNMEPDTDPAGMRPDLPALHDAWQAIFHFNGNPPLDAAGLKQLEAAREATRQQQGEAYATYILDRANIATELANRVAMGTGVRPPRFRWVPYVDALLFPLDNSGLAAATPDRAQFFPLEDKVRTKYLQQANLKTLPPTLDLYLSKLVTPILEQQKSQGAVAEKFEVAYLRSFGFDDVPRAEAARIYATLLHTPYPNETQYKRLQDFLFRYIAQECGRLNLPVHIHTTSGGGGYFSIAGDNPLLLEPLFNDPRLRKTNFVLLHGGWPFIHEIGSLLQKPNVYLDLSQQSLMISPRTMSTWLREWLELFPEKILYATDAYPYSSSMGWEEAAWIANRNIRDSLGFALTGMMQDKQITEPQAEKLAHMVLHSNAESLYKLNPLSQVPFSLSVQSRKKQYQLGEFFSLDVTITNTWPLDIGLLSGPGSAMANEYIEVIATSPSGQLVPETHSGLQAHGKENVPGHLKGGSRYSEEVPPGGLLHQKVDASLLYDFSEVGSYTLYVTRSYFEGHDHTLIKSAPIAIEITPKTE